MHTKACLSERSSIRVRSRSDSYEIAWPTHKPPNWGTHIHLYLQEKLPLSHAFPFLGIFIFAWLFHLESPTSRTMAMNPKFRTS